MNVQIADIEVGKRIRALRESVVTELVESIGRLGLQQPISVATGIKRKEGDADGISFTLVAGNHRLEACKRLGLVEIEARIVQLSDPERELWEIDENLCRADLTELERGEHLLKRKELYERLYPQTKHGGDRKGNDYQDAKNGTLTAYHVDVAERLGLAKSTIQHAIRRVKRIDEHVRDRVRDLPEVANNASELEALGDLDPAAQKKAVALVESGQAAGIRDAKKLMEPKPAKIQPHFKEAQQVEENQFLALMKAWNSAGENARERFRAEIDRPVADNTVALRA